MAEAGGKGSPSMWCKHLPAGEAGPGEAPARVTGRPPYPPRAAAAAAALPWSRTTARPPGPRARRPPARTGEGRPRAGRGGAFRPTGKCR